MFVVLEKEIKQQWDQDVKLNEGNSIVNLPFFSFSTDKIEQLDRWTQMGGIDDFVFEVGLDIPLFDAFLVFAILKIKWNSEEKQDSWVQNILILYVGQIKAAKKISKNT